MKDDRESNEAGDGKRRRKHDDEGKKKKKTHLFSLLPFDKTRPQALLDASSSPYARHLASASLLKTITETNLE